MNECKSPGVSYFSKHGKVEDQICLEVEAPQVSEWFDLITTVLLTYCKRDLNV
jgi:hypothetical protein